MKKYFTIDKRTAEYNFLDENAQLLVDKGFEIVKSYFMSKAKSENRSNFLDMLGGTSSDTAKDENDAFMTALCKYAAYKSGFNVSDFKIDAIKDPMLNRHPIFRNTFNSVIAQILRPVPPAFVSAEYMSFADVSNIAWGDSAKFPVMSNDAFFVTKHAEGILTGSIQRVYNDEINVMPELYDIKTTFDWYQIASGVFSLGDFVWRVGLSYSNYITLMIINAITEYVENGMAAAYKVSGFAPNTFAKLKDIVEAANGGAGVRAYGTLAALSSVIPGGASNSTMSNLQNGIGHEWSRVGYLGEWFGVDMIRVPQILLPNTVNTTPLLGVPNDLILLMPDGGYKPAKIVFEGSTITLNIVETESPDKQMGVDVGLRMGMAFINASKFGAVTDIVAPT